MTPLDDLAPEQRAVLELVLKRGRSYDEIAALLGIDRARVRQRALAGFDALGPSTDVAPERRALITDYLLGQLPEPIVGQVAQRLGEDPAERAWARVVASELSPVASTPLPRIPTSAELEESYEDYEAYEEGPEPAPEHIPAAAPAAEATPATAAPRSGAARELPRSSRRGGAILLGAGAAVVVIVVVLVLVLTGGSSKKPTSTSTQAASTPTTATTAATGNGTTGTTPKSLATVKLSASAAGGKAQGVAEAFVQSGKIYLALVALDLAANNHNFYAVWLSNGPSDSRLVGFSPAVTSSGQLQAAGTLLASDQRYKQLLLTLETTAHPKAPGQVILSGAFNLRSP